MNNRVLRTARLTLRPLEVADAEAFLAYYECNAAYLQAWEPARGPAFYTLERQRDDIAKTVRDRDAGLCERFIAFEPKGDEIVGSINLWNIRRGVAHMAIVGYSVAQSCAGRGYGTEMLGAVIDYAFDVLNLHRIETSYQPANRASGRVLQKQGFVVDGYATDYLFLNGAWRDGVLVSRLNPAWRAPA